MKKLVSQKFIALLSTILLLCACAALFAACGAGENDAYGAGENDAYGAGESDAYGAGESKCDHAFAGYTIVDPTCDADGSKVGVCTKCKADVKVETYPALGHTVIHGKCSRCDLEVNNPYVVVSRDIAFPTAAASYLSSAKKYAELAWTTLNGGSSSAVLNADSYIKDALNYLDKAATAASIAQDDWAGTREYKNVSTKFKKIVTDYNNLLNSEEYADWEGTSFYATKAKSTRTSMWRELSLTALDMEHDFSLAESAMDAVMDTSEYWDGKYASKRMIAYQGDFRIKASSDLTIAFDSFDPDALLTTYQIEITDGAHTYSSPARDVRAADSVTIKRCVLNADATATLTFYTVDKEKIASFTLLVIEDVASTSGDNGDNGASGNNLQSNGALPDAVLSTVYLMDKDASDQDMVSYVGSSDYTLEFTASAAIFKLDGEVTDEFTYEYDEQMNTITLTMTGFAQEMMISINGSVLTVQSGESALVFRAVS